MKRSGTVLIFVIVWVAVLFASYVIGVCVREVRFHRARTVVAATKETVTTAPQPKVVKKVEMLSETEKLAQELVEKAPATGGGEGFANRPGRQGIEAGQGADGGRGNMRERFANMSEEERAQMRERMGSRRRGGGDRMQNMSEEERAQMEERRRQMRERFENMSEEERAQMRERMGGRGRQGGRQNREQQENN